MQDTNTVQLESEELRLKSLRDENKEKSLKYSDEIKNLNQKKYNEKKNNHLYKFVLKNVRSNKIAEIKADTSIQAARYLNWRPRHTVLISKKENE